MQLFKNSKGFAFVTFESLDDKEQCVADGPHSIDLKEVEIRLCDQKSKSNSNRGGGGSGGGGHESKLDIEDVKFRRLGICYVCEGLGFAGPMGPF